MTGVAVSTGTYSATHVATNILRGIKWIVEGCGLDPAQLGADWDVLERGISTWVDSRHLRKLVLEVWDPTKSVSLVGRFDFTIDYGYYGSGDGELWLDPDTVAWAIKKNGSYASQCRYRVVADNAPGRADVSGWSSTRLRSTGGLQRHTIGTALGGGSMGASLSYWR